MFFAFHQMKKTYINTTSVDYRQYILDKHYIDNFINNTKEPKLQATFWQLSLVQCVQGENIYQLVITRWTWQ